MKEKCILIAAGGTGGHIYPALVMAKALKRMDSKIRVEFVGTPGGLEAQLIPKEGFLLHTISVGKLNKSAGRLNQIKTILTLPMSFIAALRLILKVKPNVVLGVGGYVTGPVVLIGSLLGKRTLIWEPNAVPGLANRLLAPFVTQALVVFENAKLQLRAHRILQVGMPVRSEIEDLVSEVKISQKDHIAPRKLKVLIFGGSQGARALNTVVAEALNQRSELLNQIEVIHQSGNQDYDRVKTIYGQLLGQVQLLPYIHDMAEKYRWADVVIARSGTGTVSELAAAGKAAVLIPLPTAADDHQHKNAEALFEKDAAILISQRDWTPDRFVSMIQQLLSNSKMIRDLSHNIRQFHKPHADQELARILMETI